MPCYHPLVGYKSNILNESGKRNLVFEKRHAFSDLRVVVPCGNCIGCRIERSRQWAVRCIHEASLYENNCFITLTYDSEHLPSDGSLSVKDFQDFMKRLRKATNHKIRFFHCGEYGEKFGRPHYHACLFNYDFSDKQYIGNSGSGLPQYVSPSLSKLWPFGRATIGNVTYESAAYVARYIMKKVTGVDAEKHYKGKKPEYITMSRRPGIGREWWNKFGQDVLNRDSVIIKGKELKPPRFYDRIYEHEYPSDYEALKKSRQENAKKYRSENTDERREVREYLKYEQCDKLKRGYEK